VSPATSREGSRQKKGKKPAEEKACNKIKGGDGAHMWRVEKMGRVRRAPV